MSDTEDLHKARHSLAHITAAAVQRLWPEAKFGVGPVIENGFYYDIDIPGVSISTDDFKKIEKEMRKLIGQDQKFVRTETDIDKAITWAQQNNQPYKEELLHDLKRSGTTVAKDIDAEELGITSDASAVETVSFYQNGEFIDLCRGPHVESTAEIGAFKLMRVAGAYWRGKETNPQMQRLYGVAFANKEELENYLKMLEEAKKRDHRVIGEKLNLFFITPDVGAGLPLLMPRGEQMKKSLMDYMREKEEAAGYQYVATPVLTQRKLYERSGHADYYLENMYATEEDEEGNQFFIKPMNCPHHHMIYEKMVESYRDLPLRLSEHGGLYRYELSGTLTGLIRMRGPITQNDSHTYVSAEQLKEEFRNVLEMFREVYAQTGIDDYWFRLSLPDFEKDKFAKESDKWDFAGKIIRDVLDESGLPYEEGVGEAAFYGPKLDVQTKNVLGKEDTIATVQIDILVPERMGLQYVDNQGQKQYPYVIHKSIMGAFERSMAFLLERTAGNLPVWLSPEQVRLVQVKDSDELDNFVDKIATIAKEHGVRATIDRSKESVGKKIRAAELLKIPYTIVVGEKELETKELLPRVRRDLSVDDHTPGSIPYENFIRSVANEARGRAQRSSL